jgi:REP element-mobilizing transposase RayT
MCTLSYKISCNFALFYGFVKLHSQISLKFHISVRSRDRKAVIRLSEIMKNPFMQYKVDMISFVGMQNQIKTVSKIIMQDQMKTAL